MTLVHPATRIGHVHLKVADLDRAIEFYSGVLGFELQQKFGTRAAFLSAGGYHHHLGLNTWVARPRPRGIPASITPRFSILTGRSWRMRCGG